MKATDATSMLMFLSTDPCASAITFVTYLRLSDSINSDWFSNWYVKSSSEWLTYLDLIYREQGSTHKKQLVSKTRTAPFKKKFKKTRTAPHRTAPMKYEKYRINSHQPVRAPSSVWITDREYDLKTYFRWSLDKRWYKWPKAKTFNSWFHHDPNRKYLGRWDRSYESEMRKFWNRFSFCFGWIWR